MGFYQIVSSLKTAVDMRKKAVSNISQKHDGTIIQPNARIYQELGVRACLKNHSRHMHSPLCGGYYPNLVNVARYIMPFGYTS